MSNTEKQYGLVEAKTGKKITVSDVFKNTSDSEEEDNPLKKLNQKDDKELKKQVKLEMQKALQDDPTVYQYDEIYDEMTQKKQESELLKKNPEKKPKYIHNLMKTAERRKKENERRLERQIQKEREAEGDMYKDKEEFITSSYKQKLEEFKMAEEEERKMEYIESVMDVSKQQDLGGFYRHLYKETVLDTGPINQKEPDDKKIQESNNKKFGNQDQETATQQDSNPKALNSGSAEKEKKSEPNPSSSSSDSETSSSSSSTSSSSEAEDKTDGKKSGDKICGLKSQPKEEEKVESHDKNKKDQEDKSTSKISKSARDDHKSESRDERSRNGSKSSKLDDRERRDRNSRSAYDRGRNQGRRDDRSYRDRDRRDDFKIRDRRDRRSNESKRRRSRTPENRRRRRSKSRERSSERSRSRRGYDRGNRDEREIRSNVDTKKSDSIKVEKKADIKVNEEEKENEMERPKISIWEKRTTGEVFAAALERYKQRKAARGS